MTEQNAKFDEKELEKILEALLLVAPGPVTPTQLGQALEISPKIVEKVLKSLEAEYIEHRGLRLQWHSDRVQITTAPEYGEVLENFLGLEATARLSRAALEALAIVAYRQPIIRPEIDSIRGVNSDGVMRSLLTKGLIEEIGRAEGPGRPILYGTTADFLQHFGLSSLKELPSFEEDEEETESGNGLLKD